MVLEELANKNSMKDLRPLAKKYGISLRCAKKMDVLKAASRRIGSAGRQVDPVVEEI